VKLVENEAVARGEKFNQSYSNQLNPTEQSRVASEWLEMGRLGVLNDDAWGMPSTGKNNGYFNFDEALTNGRDGDFKPPALNTSYFALGEFQRPKANDAAPQTAIKAVQANGAAQNTMRLYGVVPNGGTLYLGGQTLALGDDVLTQNGADTWVLRPRA